MSAWTCVANEGGYVNGGNKITCMNKSGDTLANAKCKVFYQGFCTSQLFGKQAGGQQCFIADMQWR
jgi:hypothetical protein